jgi:hypothetical protein
MLLLRFRPCGPFKNTHISHQIRSVQTLRLAFHSNLLGCRHGQNGHAQRSFRPLSTKYPLDHIRGCSKLETKPDLVGGWPVVQCTPQQTAIILC